MVSQNLKHVHRILVTRLRFMGDVILTTPVIRALRRAFPGAFLAYLAEQPYLSLLENNPYLDELIPVPEWGNPFLRNLLRQYQFLRYLRAYRFQLVIDLLGIPRTALLAYVTGSPIRVGGNFRVRRHLYTHRFDPHRSPWQTTIDFHLLSLKALGLEPNGSRTEVFLTDEERDWAIDYLLKRGFQLKRLLVGLHPGGTWPAKLWPWERFGELARELGRRFDAQVFVTYGPGDREIAERLKTHYGSYLFVDEVLPLRKLAALLDQMDLFISNDCGPMHLAVAVGTRTFGLFGPGEPWIWFPYSLEEGHRAIYKPVPCRPCHKDFCPLNHECMKAITVEDVLEAAKEIL